MAQGLYAQVNFDEAGLTSNRYDSSSESGASSEGELHDAQVVHRYVEMGWLGESNQEPLSEKSLDCRIYRCQ